MSSANEAQQWLLVRLEGIQNPDSYLTDTIGPFFVTASQTGVSQYNLFRRKPGPTPSLELLSYSKPELLHSLLIPNLLEHLQVSLDHASTPYRVQFVTFEMDAATFGGAEAFQTALPSLEFSCRLVLNWLKEKNGRPLSRETLMLAGRVHTVFMSKSGLTPREAGRFYQTWLENQLGNHLNPTGSHLQDWLEKEYVTHRDSIRLFLSDYWAPDGKVLDNQHAYMRHWANLSELTAQRLRHLNRQGRIQLQSPAFNDWPVLWHSYHRILQEINHQIGLGTDALTALLFWKANAYREMKWNAPNIDMPVVQPALNAS